MAIFIPVSLFEISRISQAEKTVIPSVLFVGGVVGYYVITAPWRYPQRILQTIYAITDQRALVHQGFGWSLLWLQGLPGLYNTHLLF